MDPSVFEIEETVRFCHCDPAGIVFFPQYLVMLNTLHERWFGEALGVPYHEYIGTRRLGLPTVRLECDFTAISRHGDRLRQRLMLNKLGRTSLELAVEFEYGVTDWLEPNIGNTMQATPTEVTSTRSS